MNWLIVLRSQEVKIVFTEASSGAGTNGRILGMVPECEYLDWPEQTPPTQPAWADGLSQVDLRSKQ